MVPQAQEVDQGELDRRVNESEESLAEDGEEAVLCEEIAPDTLTGRRRSCLSRIRRCSSRLSARGDLLKREEVHRDARDRQH